MNTTPFTNTPAFLSIHPSATAGRRQAALSARQLLDVELGLFLLSQLQPTASPDALPVLLSLSIPNDWTPRQRKLLNRGRLLLTQFQHHPVWFELLDRYIAVSNPLRHAYDVSADRSRFAEKNVGFFRNRLSTFRQVLS